MAYTNAYPGSVEKLHEFLNEQQQKNYYFNEPMHGLYELTKGLSFVRFLFPLQKQ